MPKPKTVPNKLLIGFSDNQLAELDNQRKRQEDLPTRSELVRRLVDGGLQQMAPQGHWRGFLRLSLVTCPVTLYLATTPTQKVSFHQINRSTGNRIKYVKVDAVTGNEVAPDEIVKGYKDDSGAYIEVTKEDLKNIVTESTHTIEIDEFVPKSGIDYRYIVQSYFLVPDGKVGHDAYVLIRETMRTMNKIAIGRLVMGSREHVIAVEPLAKGMMATILRYPYEVRDEAEYFDDIEQVKVTKDMLDLAKHIVEQKTGEFDPSKFEDHYEAALVELLKKKQKRSLKASDDFALGNVIDLMDALKKSLSS